MFQLLKRFMGWVTGSTLYRFLGNQFKRMGRSLRPSNWFSQRKKRGKRMRKPAALRVDQPRWYLRPFYFLGRQLKRLFHNLHPFILIPFLGRQGKRLIQAVWHSRLIRFLGDRLNRILRSLWFRLMAAFTAVILIMLFMVSGVISNITQREFGQYIRERNEYIRSVIPTLVPGQGVVVVDGRTFREVSEILEIPEIPEIPELPTLPVGGKISELPEASELVSPQEPPTSDINVDVNVDELVEEVIVDEIVVQIPGFEEILVPDSVEEQGLQFLGDVREATETAVIVGGIVSFVLGTMLFWQITRPLAKLRQATQDIAQGQTGVRVPVRRQDEMGKVGTAFNQMAIQIEQQEQVRKQMVADVAHELRTPLTVMKSNLEAMLDGLIHPTNDELGELHDEVERMSRMIDDLRLLSLADAGQLTLMHNKVDLRHLVEMVVVRMTPLADEQCVQLVSDTVHVPLFAQADSDRLQQAIGNLVDNGIRHAKVGGTVRITAVQERHVAHISIVDDGPGIPDTDIPHLFERFWRGDKSRTRNSGGSGLGLSIVKQIVDMHGGSIQVVSLNGSGTTFTISLPLAN